MLNRTRTLAGFFLMTVVTIQVCPSQENDPRDLNLDVHLNPHHVLGVESCQKCHAAEVGVWKQTPHNTTFMTLHRNPAAQEIANRMGIQSFKTDSACVKCHYTMKADSNHALEAISGISCESCHGAAKNWIEPHNDFGGSTAALDKPKAHNTESTD